MGRDVCDRWADADPERVAIVDRAASARREVSYAELRSLADDLAHRLKAVGVGRNDRVAVLMGQGASTAAAHVAIWKSGAVSLPLSTLFGPDALSARLDDSGACAAIADAHSADALHGVCGRFPMLEHVIAPGDAENAAAGSKFEAVDTAADDPAILIYTSGTTGAPKGALHAHRVLLGHLPGVELSHDLLPQPGDRLWTPADWAWIGGLLDVLMPGLYHGVPVVASRFRKFDPASAKELIEAEGVKNVFFPPTALRMIKAAECEISGLRSVACGGEPLGAEMLAWGRDALGAKINEFYGQTECNMVVSSCGAMFPHRPGWIGRPVPGHDVGVIAADGCELDGVEGDIAVRRGTPVMMLRYWNRPEATAEKFRGDWMLTGDRGVSEDGFIRFVGRDDDVITSAGYRIGPAEVEDCLLTHEAVASAGVVGKPDAVRTEIVKAFVVLREGCVADGSLARDLQEFVRTRLAAHEFPREIEFVDSLPMTVTGKVMRRALRERAVAETGDAG